MIVGKSPCSPGNTSSNGPCSRDQPGFILEFKRCLDRFVLDLGVFWSDQTQKALEESFEKLPFKMLCSNSSLYLTPPENERLKIHLKIAGPHQKAKISTHCLEVSRPFLCQKSTLGIRKNPSNWVYFRGPPKHPCWPYLVRVPTDPYGRSSSWWFQPIWKILVKIDSFPEFRDAKKNIWNHHLVIFCGGGSDPPDHEK